MNEVGDEKGNNNKEWQRRWAALQERERIVAAKESLLDQAQRSSANPVSLTSLKTAVEEEERDEGGEQKVHFDESLTMYLANGKFLRSAVFGGLDGLTTCIVLIVSTNGLLPVHHLVEGGGGDGHVVPGSVSTSRGILPSVVLTLGLANLIADAFSMAMGDYFSSLADAETTHHSTAHSPPSSWWHWTAAQTEAARNGCVMFLSFVIFGFVPLVAYFPILSIAGPTRLRWAAVLGALSLFLLGVLKGHVLHGSPQRAKVQTTALSTRRSRILSMVGTHARTGLQMVLNGGIAAAISLLIAAALPSE